MIQDPDAPPIQQGRKYIPYPKMLYPVDGSAGFKLVENEDEHRAAEESGKWHNVAPNPNAIAEPAVGDGDAGDLAEPDDKPQPGATVGPPKKRRL